MTEHDYILAVLTEMEGHLTPVVRQARAIDVAREVSAVDYLRRRLGADAMLLDILVDNVRQLGRADVALGVLEIVRGVHQSLDAAATQGVAHKHPDLRLVVNNDLQQTGGAATPPGNT